MSIDTGLNVILVEDSALFRAGLARLLTLAGMNVTAELRSAEPLSAVLQTAAVDVVILDVRLPPSFTDEGVRAAVDLHAARPDLGVLVLSTYVDGTWARQLFANGSAGLGYLLKDRVDDVATFVEAIRRVHAGGTVVDPEVVTQLVNPTAHGALIEALSDREQAVLRLMAEGRSNLGIGQELYLSPRTVETHINSIFTKIPLDPADRSANKRVLAVLTYLQRRT